METKTNPSVEIEIGGKLRHLLLDLNAMATFEEIVGKSFFDLSETEHMGARELRAFLYVCLLHEDDSLTLEQVGSWITMESMGGIAKRLTRALKAAMPDSREGKDNAPLPKKSRRRG